MERLLTLFLILASSAFSLSHDYYELAVFGGEPSSLVDGCVSAITGDYFISQDLLKVRGHEPIQVQSQYLSRRGTHKFGGWSLLFNHVLATLEVTRTPSAVRYFLQIPEKLGVSLVYAESSGVGKAKAGQIKFSLIDCPGGLTNCSTGEISARLNLRNNVVYRDIDRKQFIVEGADGSKRCYRVKRDLGFDKPNDKLGVKTELVFLYLAWEVLPNGNVVHYDYHRVQGEYELKDVWTTSGDGKTVYAQLHLSYTKPDSSHLYHIKITSSDGQEVNLQIDPHQKNGGQRFWLLRDVFHPCLPNQTYDYAGWKHKGVFLSRQVLPEGRGLSIHYYHRYDNVLPKGVVRVKDEKDPLYKRVRELRAPVGVDSSFQTSRHFYYASGEYGKSVGYTDVYDAENNLTRYRYNADLLLTEVERYLGNSKLFSKELFLWHDKKSKYPNWLYGKTLLNEVGQPLFAQTYHYDDKGNVVEHRFTGNLSGEERGRLTLDGQGLPQGGESFSVKRQFYSNNLLFKEVEPNGRVTEYHYVPNTDLIAAKFICEGEKVKLRNFYVYAGTVLVQEIIDNGSERDKESLSNVTERLVKNIEPVQEGKFVGFPKEIREGYLDRDTGQTVLLSKKVLTYNHRGLVQSVEHYDAFDQYQYTLTYAYDGKDRLVMHTDPLGRKKLVAYDANDNPIISDDANENFTQENKYDYSNRLTKSSCIPSIGEEQSTHHFYNHLHQKVREYDPQGNFTTQRYDPFGHPVMTILPTVGCQQPVIKRKFNALGKVETETDPKGHVTTTYYTSHGKPCRVLYPDGTEERSIYTLEGNLKKHILPSGTEVHYAYDFLDRIISKKMVSKEGELLAEESYVYDAFNLLEKVDPDGVVTRYTYDGAGRKVKEEVLDRVTKWTYDPLGRVQTVTQGPKVLVKEYDLLDRLTKETEEDLEGNIYGFTAYTYDDFSNKVALTKEVHVGEALERTEYDPFRRVIKNTDPLGHATTTTYDDRFKNRFAQIVIQKTTVDPKGKKAIETFNTHGHLDWMEIWSPSGERLLRENFEYDLKGQKVKQVSELFYPEKTTVKAWEYDERGRVITLKEAVGEPIEKVTRYAYTPDGLIKELTKPDGTTIAYSYDGLGRQVAIQTKTTHYTLEYDKMGHVIASHDIIRGTHATRSYTHFGELLKETLSTGLTTERTYDSLGRKTSLTLPDGSQVLYSYDPYHLRSVVRQHPSGEYLHEYLEYDKSHNLLQESLAKELGTLDHAIDLMSRRIQSDCLYSTESIPSFDPNGNVTEYQRYLKDHEEFSVFTYDALDQLIQERGLFDHDYGYDSHHNRLLKDDDTYEVNALHELVSTSQVEYDHDLNGNRILAQKQESEVHYLYDDLDRLVQILGGEYAIRFTYDSWNRCVTQHWFKKEEGQWNRVHFENYLYDEQNELGTLLHLRILGQGKGAEIGATVAIEKEGQVSIPIHDLFGNIIAVLDSQGNVQESYRFTAFGEEAITTEGTPQNPWRYQSKRKVGTLVAFGRRFYDPETGRWLSPDPKGFDEGPNLYQYVKNNPLILFDLYGLEAEGRQGSRFLEDLKYLYSYTWRATLDGKGTFNFGKSSYFMNLCRAYKNLLTGNRVQPNMSHSKVITVGEHTNPSIRPTFVTGIWTSQDEAKVMGESISKMLGGQQVDVIANSTHGLWDLVDLFAEKMGMRTNVVKLTEKHLQKVLDSGLKPYIFTQSEGTAITYRATEGFSLEQRSKMTLNAFASTHIIPGEHLGSVSNHLSHNDFIGIYANPIRAHKASLENSPHVNFLQPATNNPFEEHKFFGKTTQSKLSEICADINNKYGFLKNE